MRAAAATASASAPRADVERRRRRSGSSVGVEHGPAPDGGRRARRQLGERRPGGRHGGLGDAARRRRCPDGVRGPVDLLAAGVGGDEQLAAATALGHACVREGVEAAQAVHGDAEAKAKVRPVTMPTRRPVNGPGPMPTTTSVTSPGVAPAAASTRAMRGARCSACAAGVERRTLGDDRRAVVQGDGDGGRGGVDREQQHAVRLPHQRSSRAAASAGSRARSAHRRDGSTTSYGALRRSRVSTSSDDLEPVVAQLLGQPCAPLDDGHAVVERGVEVEVVELERRRRAGRRRRGPAPGRRPATGAPGR